jgi:DNA-binding SARP family transcriptional activator
VEYGILGPLAVWEDGRELRLGGRRGALLAMLLLRRNELVPTDRLIEDLWAGAPPPTALPVVRNLVSQLRKALGEDALETRPLGYVLRVADGALDLQRFERLLDQGRAELGVGRAAEAAAAFREALALWRGPPLADFRYESFARDEIGRLEELRLVALEQRLDADLAAGRHAQAAPELETLVREHPLRERLRWLLMLALYRSGRQADALAAYQDGRAALVDELGLEPDQSLQRLEQAILRQDPSLDLRPSAPPPPAEPDEPGQPPRAQRKVVTVLSLGIERPPGAADPEAIDTLLARVLARARATVARHGGAVDDFVGETAMAVFGLPAVHEDDALRALRAAAELREALAELDARPRIGVATGEVVAGGGRGVTGDAVLVAAGLQRAAQPGEVVAAEATVRLAGGAATVEPVDGPGAGAAFRLVSVSAAAPARSFDALLVGRGDELAVLRAAWERVGVEHRCELVTVVGAAGIGKSRLVAEFVREAAAYVTAGRCLSYGAGITYWPVLEVLGQLRSFVERLEPAVAAPLRALLGDDAVTSTDELAWAFRKLVETAARARPLVVVLDDLQWAEEALLDLVEHVAYVSSGAPVLLLCMARPELLERRPAWGGVLRLEPLTPGEAEELALDRLGDERRNPSVARRIAASSGGNPLFVEELAAVLHEAGERAVAMPPTIQALLGARLDQLDPDERAVLEAAAVEGEVFHRGAVHALAPGEPRLTAVLTSLVRKELVRPERPQLEGEDAFRFRHLLLRDAAYDSISKAARAELHVRFADWLEQREGDTAAIVGFHLEQATRYRTELGVLDDDGVAVAARAGSLLADAGRDAFARGDMAAAANLLERAAALLRDDGLTTSLLPNLGAALRETGDLSRAEEILATAVERAEQDENLAARLDALVELATIQLLRDPGAAETERLVGEVERGAAALEAVADDHILARAWTFVGLASGLWKGRQADGEEALERALGHARRAGDRRQEAVVVGRLVFVAAWGPTPVPSAIARCRELLADAEDNHLLQAEVLQHLAALRGREGHFDEARELAVRARDGYEELGMSLIAHATRAFASGEIELLAEDFDAAAYELRTAYDALAAMGERAYLSSVAALLARAHYGQGRLDDALAMASAAEAGAGRDDIWSQVTARGPHAKVLARRGRHELAEQLAREAVAVIAGTDALELHGTALLDLADVVAVSGRDDEAAGLAHEALLLFERKDIPVLAGVARRVMEQLGAPGTRRRGRQARAAEERTASTGP